MISILTERVMLLNAAVAVIFLAGVGPAFAQDEEGAASETPRQPIEMERGAEHERLDFFIGNWEGMFEADLRELGYEDPVHFSTEVSFEWMEPGGVWLREDTILNLPWGASWGQGMWAYDTANDQLLRRWIDNQIPEIFFHSGDWIDDRTIVFDGFVDYAGGRIVMRDIFRITGPDNYVWEHFTDGGQGAGLTLSSTTTYNRVSAPDIQEQ